MNDREQAEMHAVMGAKLRELGYDENPAGAAPEAAAAGIGR